MYIYTNAVVFCVLILINSLSSSMLSLFLVVGALGSPTQTIMWSKSITDFSQ